MISLRKNNVKVVTTSKPDPEEKPPRSHEESVCSDSDQESVSKGAIPLKDLLGAGALAGRVGAAAAAPSKA